MSICKRCQQEPAAICVKCAGELTDDETELELNTLKSELNILREKLLDTRESLGKMAMAEVCASHGAMAVIAERRRQIVKEGWTAEHDDQHTGFQLSLAAACYALRAPRPELSVVPPHDWPWDREWWKPGPDSRRMLVKAAALLIAEIDRLDRKAGVRL